MTRSDRSFHSHLDPPAISRWVAGSTSNHRFVFLAFMSDVNMRLGGKSAVHDIYALSRFSSRSDNPLEAYSMKRRITRRLVTLPRAEAAKRRLATIQTVDVRELVNNTEIHGALARLFKTVGHDDFASRDSRGAGSQFDRCFFCGSVFIEPMVSIAPNVNPGMVEIETTIYCHDSIDLQLHSVFRVDGPGRRG